MKKRIALAFFLSMALLLSACKGGGSKPTRAVDGNAEIGTERLSDRKATHDLLKGGYAIDLSGGWRILCPADASNRNTNNSYGMTTADGKTKILYAGYFDGCGDFPQLCEDFNGLLQACTVSIKVELSGYYSTTFTPNTITIADDKQEKLRIGAYDMVKINGTVSDSHKGGCFAFEAYLTLLDISGTKAPVYLFGYCEPGSEKDMSTLLLAMITSLSKNNT